MEEEKTEVRVLSKEEREQYDGVTIDEATGENYDPEAERRNVWEQSGIKIRTFSFQAIPLWKKILFGAVIVLILGSLLFVGGFILMGVIGAALLVWLWNILRSFF